MPGILLDRMVDMFLLPKRDLERAQIGPILWLIRRNFAWSIRELPCQLGFVNLLQFLPQKDYPLFGDVVATVVMNVRDVQVVEDSLD